MTRYDLRQLAHSLMRQARLFKMQGETEFAASLMERSRSIWVLAKHGTTVQPALVPARITRR